MNFKFSTSLFSKDYKLKQLRAIFLCFLITFFCSFLKGQETVLVEADSSYEVSEIPFSELNNWTNHQRYYGYSIDSIVGDSAFVYLGEAFPKIHLILGKDTLNGHPKDWRKSINQVLNDLNDEGYPFTQIEVVREGDAFTTNVKKGTKVVLDSLSFDPSIIRSKVLEEIIGIKTGDAFNRSALMQVDEIINSMPYIQLNSEPRLKFYKDRFVLYLDLTRVNRNQFNGFVGLIPDNTDPNVTTYSLNGNLRLDLQNALGMAERLSFNWNRLTGESQMLEVSSSLPYLFGTPYGTDLSLDLIRRDSSFLNLRYKIGGQYQLGINQSISVFYQVRSTSTINQQTELVNSRTNSYGASLKFNRTDDLLIPLNGFLAEFTLAAGNRSFDNSDEDSVNVIISQTPELTVLIPNRTLTLDYEFRFNWYKQLAKKIVINHSLLGAGLVNNYLFQNDLLFVGGLNTVRGVDDNSLLTSSYYINRNEFRLHLERYSYLVAFFDVSYLERNLFLRREYQWVYSGGLGVRVSSKAGIFSLYYGLAKLENQPLFLRDAKVHIGFTNQF